MRWKDQARFKGAKTTENAETTRIPALYALYAVDLPRFADIEYVGRLWSFVCDDFATGIATR